MSALIRNLVIACKRLVGPLGLFALSALALTLGVANWSAVIAPASNTPSAPLVASTQSGADQAPASPSHQAASIVTVLPEVIDRVHSFTRSTDRTRRVNPVHSLALEVAATEPQAQSPLN